MNPSGISVFIPLTCYLPIDPAYKLYKVHYVYGPYDGQRSYEYIQAYSHNEAREKFKLPYPVNFIEECNADLPSIS